MSKVCTKCGIEKSLYDYYKTSKSRLGLRTECKTCTNKSNRSWYKTVSEENGDRLKAHRESGRKTRLKNNFGMSIEDYNKLLISQNYKCAVCNKHSDDLNKKMAVDHAHSDSPYFKSGEVRGLLCEDCNLRLIGDRIDPEIFFKAANYLMRKSN
ncbi:putative recombination endonuclease VII protein [Rhizobium phage RHph_I3_11]|nr:putative recombination endonuclease VII protein [Rhizobium phage RHph_I3_11]